MNSLLIEIYLETEWENAVNDPVQATSYVANLNDLDLPDVQVHLVDFDEPSPLWKQCFDAIQKLQGITTDEVSA